MIFAEGGKAASANNIDYLLRGYNVFKADPEAGGLDPGYALPVFDATYTRNQLTADGRYRVPDFYDILRINGCNLDFFSSVITGEDSLTKSYSLGATVEGGASYGGFGAKFKASAGYKSKTQQISTNKKVYVSSSAECAVYQATLRAYGGRPSLSAQFTAGIQTLIATTDISKYHQFIDRFGTHYPESMTLGARYGFSSVLTVDGYQKLKETQVDIGYAASASFKNITVGTDYSASWQT